MEEYQKDTWKQKVFLKQSHRKLLLFSVTVATQWIISVMLMYILNSENFRVAEYLQLPLASSEVENKKNRVQCILEYLLKIKLSETFAKETNYTQEIKKISEYINMSMVDWGFCQFNL